MTTNQGSSATAGAAEQPDETQRDSTGQQDSGPSAAELAAELKKVRAENTRLKKAAEPEPAADTEPAPLTHVLALACGDTVLSPNPHPSHHYCEHHGTVPVTGVWDRSADELADQAT
jgi:hypothetical protein